MNRACISNGKRDCHRVFQDTFLPAFRVISEMQTVILVLFLKSLQGVGQIPVTSYFYTSSNGALKWVQITSVT